MLPSETENIKNKRQYRYGTYKKCRSFDPPHPRWEFNTSILSSVLFLSNRVLEHYKPERDKQKTDTFQNLRRFLHENSSAAL